MDVIKTRYMNALPGEYRGALDAAVRMFMQEGPGAFYKGSVAGGVCVIDDCHTCWLA